MAVRHRCRAAIGALAAAALVAVPATAGASDASAPGASRAPAVDVRAEQWWLDVLGAERIWQEHTRGEGVVVAVIDSGVEPSGDLDGGVDAGFTHTGSGRGDSDGDTEEFHGTGMATKIAGRGTDQGLLGMAPEATILPVKVPALNQEDYTTQALRTLAAMDDPPEVVNMSYNGSRDCSPDEQAAVREAVDAGMILVASAGNNGGGTGLPTSPASCAGVLAVGAYGYFGNIGDTPDLRMWPDSEQHDYVALAAPGIDMIAYEPGSDEPLYHDGTSDAAAVASGSIALVRAAFPDMPSRELVARVLATARPLDDRFGVRSQEWGFGSVRPFYAIEDDVPADAPNPVYDALDQAAPPTNGGGNGDGGSSGGSDPGPAGGEAGQGSDAADDTDDSDDGAPVGLLVGGGIAVVVVLVLLGVVAARRRSPSSAGPGSPA